MTKSSLDGRIYFYIINPKANRYIFIYVAGN